jgi:hypothetical protein
MPNQDEVTNNTPTEVTSQSLSIESSIDDHNNLHQPDVKRFESVSRRLNTIKSQILRTKERIQVLRGEIKRGFYYQETDGITGAGRAKRKLVTLDRLNIVQREHEIHRFKTKLTELAVEQRKLRLEYRELDRSIRSYSKVERKTVIERERAVRDPDKFIKRVRVKLHHASQNGEGKRLLPLKEQVAADPYGVRNQLSRVLSKIDPVMNAVVNEKPTLREKLFDVIFGEIPEGVQKPTPEIY